MSLDTRWKKLYRDLTDYRGRALALLAAVTVGVFSIGTMLGAYGIVKREVPVNYLATNPAHATIELDEVTPEVLAAARGFPGVAVAEARAVIEARARVGAEWMRMLLFVVEDFGAMRLNTFSRESGAWPPPAGAMLVERLAVDFLKKGEGESLIVRMPGGATRELPIAGIVHDTTLAPAWQEQTGYGYIALSTLAGLGVPPVLDELRILFVGGPQDVATIDAQAIALARVLRAQGAKVHSIKVPPPGEHPHENLMQASLRNFVILSGLALVLSAILVAAVLAGILARQGREIGVMKAIGAQSGQIARMYAALLLVLGAVSLAIGLPLSAVFAARRSQTMADTLNFTVTDAMIPVWVYGVVLAAGLLVPLAMSVPTIVRASRTTVRAALGSVGVSTAFGAGRLDRALTGVRGIGLPYVLAVRNTFRRRGRLALALTMLTAGGSLFMTSVNLSDSWRAMAERIKTDRLYDANFRLIEPVAKERIAAALAQVAGIRKYEVWGASQAAFTQEGRDAVMRTYPDHGHGSFSLYGIPPQTEMIAFPVVQGRWLAEGDIDAIVVSQRHLAQGFEAKVGDRVQLLVDDRATSWQVAGVIQEVGGGGGAYVSSAGYAQATGSAEIGGDIRLIAAARTAEERSRVARAAERALDDAGIGIERSMPLDRLYAAMVGHIEVPSRMLIGAALILVFLGGIGVASMMTINVLERTREIGVMKAIGAAPATVVKIITAEGLFIGAVSWVLAVAISLPATWIISLVGRAMGTLPFAVSIVAGAIWLGLVFVIAVAASAIPAARAARLVVREALAYE